MEKYAKVPAKVRYIGPPSEEFTRGRVYPAYFLEYWQGKRESQHVRGDSGRISDFNLLGDFEVVEDGDHVLNCYEAVVKCVTHRYDGMRFGLTFGKEYKAIGRDRDGLYLVMDESSDCYFYPPDVFEVVSDAHDLLSHQSVYTAISYTIRFVTDGGTVIADQTYTIDSSGPLPTTTKTGYAFQGWTVAATTAGDPIGWGATADESASLTGKYGNVTLTAQWKLAVTAKLFDYGYAPSGYQLLVVSGDSANYSYGGADMHYTTEAAYKSLIDGGEGVYLYLVETSAYAESSIAISDDTRTTLERSGDVNGDSRVDIADANAVYRMIQNFAQGNYYTLTQVNILGRLVADMDADYDKNVPYGASIADVQAILNKING